MKEYYLVDGYNVINNWPEFANVREKDLEHARDMLTDKVAEFSAFHGYYAVVVFDATNAKGPEVTEHIRGCTVVYTAEQDSVLGSGAFRIPAREFRELYYKTKKQIEDKIDKLPGNTGRREIGGRIGGDVALYMEKLRRG